MRIRCTKFGDDYTQVQGHEDTIVDFLQHNSFYTKWTYTCEKDKLYHSEFTLTHPVTLQTQTFKNTPDIYYKLMPKGEVLIEKREESSIYTAVQFVTDEKTPDPLQWVELLLHAPNFHSIKAVIPGHEYTVHTVNDEEEKTYQLFEGGVIIFNEHGHIKTIFNDEDKDGFKKTLVINGYQPI